MRTLPNHIVFAELKDRIGRGESVILPLVGHSMEVALQQNRDKVKLAPIQEPLQLHGVYLFEFHGHFIMHRLVKIEGDTLTFRGDNCISSEVVSTKDVIAQLESIKRGNKEISVASKEWQRLSNVSILRGHLKRLATNLMCRKRRKQYRPWYFLALALLMWLPLNGLAEVFPNYILGLRIDHFIHASVFIPCTWMLMDLLGKRWYQLLLLLLLGSSVGMVTEGVQYLLPYRGYDVNDLVANFCGVALGWLIYLCKLKK